MHLPGPKKRKFIEEQKAKIRGKVSRRVELLVGRGYLYGHIEKPVELLSDEELLNVPSLGAITLYDIRQVIPSPQEGELVGDARVTGLGESPK